MSAAVIIVILVIVIPVGFLITMSLVAAVLGTLLKDDRARAFEGREELELS